MPFLKKRYFEPTKSFFKLSDSSIVNQIRLVIAIFKCKSCSMRKETCLQFKTMTVSTHDLVYYYTRKKGFCNHCRTVSYSFFIEMLFQWCIFCLINKVLIQTSFFMLFVLNGWYDMHMTLTPACLFSSSGYMLPFWHVYQRLSVPLDPFHPHAQYVFYPNSQ